MTGASYNKKTNKWVSRIRLDGINYYLGLYDTKIEAEAQYMKKKMMHTNKKNMSSKIKNLEKKIENLEESLKNITEKLDKISNQAVFLRNISFEN